MPLQMHVLDGKGHSTVEGELEATFNSLKAKGYAAFLNNVQISSFPSDIEDGEILMLAPIAGG